MSLLWLYIVPSLLGVALAATEPVPTATLTWKSAVGRVVITAPEGYHVAAESPATLVVGDLRIDGHGDLAQARVALPSGPVEAALSFALCTDTGTDCRPLTLHLSGTVSGRKGEIRFESPGAAAAHPAALGSAVRLYDFTAVWCPPCNLLAAEVLHNPAHIDLVGRLDVVPVDVDKADGWALKNQYTVGGYPTLIAVDTAGREVGRLVGYPGEDPTISWLNSLEAGVPIHQLLSGPPASAVQDRTPAAAATAAKYARILVDAQHEDAAAAWLTLADDGVDAHIARLGLHALPEDAEWLVNKAPAGSWLTSALTVAPKLWPRALPKIAALPPTDAADCLSVVADAVGGEDGKALRVAAIVTLRTTFTGDPAHDRAHITFLAELHQQMGDPQGALTLLDDYTVRYPAEFTFDYAATRLLVDEKRWLEAVARGRVALDKAWGDQRLRAVQPLARALAEVGRMPEALALLDAELAATPRPDEATKVRTTRYIAQVEALKKELPANVSTPLK